MEQGAPLEERLRTMILSNVTISDNQDGMRSNPLHRGQHQHRYYQRGRGLHHNAPHAANQEQGSGNRSRGRGGRYHAPQERGTYPRQYHQRTHGPNQILQRPQGPPRFHGAPIPQQQRAYEDPLLQIEHLDGVASIEVPKAQITTAEVEAKEAFRKSLETLCQGAIDSNHSGNLATISLQGFGSLASGFGMPGSDMDLAVVPVWKNTSLSRNSSLDKNIPRVLEKAVLDSKLGGRLLTRTRVPILKICEHPTDELYTALLEERHKWDELPEEEKYPTSIPLHDRTPQPSQSAPSGEEDAPIGTDGTLPVTDAHQATSSSGKLKQDSHQYDSSPAAGLNGEKVQLNKGQHDKKSWHREKVLGPLDFPKSGVGIQCDLNFNNTLGIHNTELLHCYSLCDERVRLMVLFVKAWAKRRKVNSSYSGTLSSYGWVLMVLHYLVNIASPPVCPNLQIRLPTPVNLEGLGQLWEETVIENYAVRFWRDREAIKQAAQAGTLTQNTQSVAALLRGFFYYYAAPPVGFGPGPRHPTFYWTREVLSLRTLGGIRTKDSKGWTGAKTTNVGGKEVRHRYLFAIEDPFELDHNVARTVTHNGIVAIRDEFRRVWRILGAIGRGEEPEGGIFDEVVEQSPPTPTLQATEESIDSLQLRRESTHETKPTTGLDSSQT
ncbi:Poly(A) RNA polymerase cid13 [Aaosphaeria arxii CBS 175.79]|uniref:polynucleotide adenylyltransferase n=1 Tax=Aaosphaeria arxii CBS 175.79 TaxID=1450172 RepID=A0A6A5XA09_9PLEO|nr:Poly(A) RNA polymerase cid13 [Aaosphaeria arxii CBS 175.79]KAF2009760.1 Poly(A) RNA polymerase cid13 [Aaosphaeria arxii CBS 175.79]